MKKKEKQTSKFCGKIITLPSRWQSDYYLAISLYNAVADKVVEFKALPLGCVVDLGCGSMPYAGLIGPVCLNYIGCDLTGTGANVEFEVGGQVPLQDSTADLLVSFQVLEHVEDVAWYCAEAKRLLASDGHLLLSTHGVWPYHPHPHDYRRWTREGLVLDLERNGFEVQSVQSIVGPGAWTLMFQFGAVALLLEKLGFLGRATAGLLNFTLSYVLPLVDKVTPKKFRDENASVYVVVARPRSL